MAKNVAVLAGYWSTNIGNSFFQLGAEWVVRQMLPDAHVFLIGDQPGYYKVSKGNPRNALDYVAHLDIDALVMLGPFARPEAPQIVGDMLEALHRKGTKIIVLAAGMMQYDDQTVGTVREMLAKSPPWIFTTRDSETYQALGDTAEHAYDGIDVATFVSDLFPPVPHDLDEYVVLNFDQIPEPSFRKGEHKGKRFSWRGETWTAVQPGLRTEMSYKSRVFPFLEAFLPAGKAPEKLAGMDIVRTEHRYNPFMPRRSYRRPNAYAGDIPQTYLNLYAHSACTFSNRVHACVATAAYGNPAMLFTRSPRAYLLKRLGLTKIKDEPTRLDMDFLRREKAGMLDWLKEKTAGF